MDIAEVVLRLIGAFYVFAGYVATRAALTSHFIDRAIAAIAAQRPKRAETLHFAWLLCAAIIVLMGGVALMLLLDIAAWLFLVSALGQAAFLFVAAPHYFDVDDPPDPRGRRQSTNAFVVYSAATAFVLWADYTGRLIAWREAPPPLLAVAAAAVAAQLVYVAFLLRKAPSRSSPLGSLADPAASELPRLRSEAKRIKVMADYDTHPLWALDEDLYGDIPPEDMGLSEDLTRDLNAWAEAYNASCNRADPASSLWSEEQHRGHAAQARPLAIRLARERPDLAVYILDGETGVVEVHAHEQP
jgi:hypothetical protein